MYFWVCLTPTSINNLPARAWLILLLGWAIAVRAQPLNPSFEQYTTDDGLSSNYVTAILKDRRGFMWFGISNGLNRFDGITFRLFKRTENWQSEQRPRQYRQL